jgi:hypothetical protein
MIWILEKLMAWLNKPADYTAELEELRRKQGFYDKDERG